jgi:hypothetical protein
MATLITKQNYTVDNVPVGLIDHLPTNVRQLNELATEFNVGASFQSFTTQALAANNTQVNANLGAATYSNGITLAGDALSFTVATSGTYSIDSTLQFFKNNTTSEGTMTAWYTVNGTAFANRIDGTANSESLAISNQLTILNIHAHLVLNAGDSVRLMFAGNSSTTPGLFADLQLRASVSATPYPAIASISIEIDKVR